MLGVDYKVKKKGLSILAKSLILLWRPQRDVIRITKNLSYE